jgi:hypothetical protein
MEKKENPITEALRLAMESTERTHKRLLEETADIQRQLDFQNRSEGKGLRFEGPAPREYRALGYYQLHCNHNKLIFEPCTKCKRGVQEAFQNAAKYMDAQGVRLKNGKIN